MLFRCRELGRLVESFYDKTPEIFNAAKLPHETGAWIGGHAVPKIRNQIPVNVQRSEYFGRNTH